MILGIGQRCTACPVRLGVDCLNATEGPRWICRAIEAGDPQWVESTVQRSETPELWAARLADPTAYAGVDAGTMAASLARVAACPDRGGVLSVSMQREGCGCGELSACRAGKGSPPGRVTLRECLDCRASAGPP